MCWVIPPCSPSTTFAFRKTSKREVLPWSTWPITVTIGGLDFKFSFFVSLIFLIMSSAFSSLIGLCPNSFTKYSAISVSIAWFIVAFTPIVNKCFIKLLDCSLIRFASSLIVIISGIETSLLTGLYSCFSSLSCSLFSFSLARLIEARLLPFNSLASSSPKALEIVSFNSLFFGLLLSLFSFVASPLSLLVALCSANFLFSKSDRSFLGKKLGLFFWSLNLYWFS